MAISKSITSKPQLESKSFTSMTPPKVGFLRPIQDFWAKKSFLGPPKTQKIDFLKKPQLRDLTKHWRWFPQWPQSPGYHQTPVYNSKINYLAVAQCDPLTRSNRQRLNRIYVQQYIDFTDNRCNSKYLIQSLKNTDI